MATTGRPVSVTIVAWIYILAGIGGIAAHISEFNARHPLDSDSIMALIVRILAIVAGAFMLRGSNWARWLAIAWIAFHVLLSAFHPVRELVVHCVLFAVFAYLLFRSAATAYFARQNVEQA